MSLIGVLGGMGPSATVDFMAKIIQLTPATRDQEHLPVIIANLPHVPDRSSAILGRGEDPLPALLRGIDMLNQAKVGVLAIPCNSSHHWYTEMAERSDAPIIHIAQACVAAIPASHQGRIAVLATRGALASGFYQEALRARGLEFVVPDDTQRTTARTVEPAQSHQGRRHSGGHRGVGCGFDHGCGGRRDRCHSGLHRTAGGSTSCSAHIHGFDKQLFGAGPCHGDICTR